MLVHIQATALPSPSMSSSSTQTPLPNTHDSTISLKPFAVSNFFDSLSVSSEESDLDGWVDRPSIVAGKNIKLPFSGPKGKKAKKKLNNLKNVKRKARQKGRATEAWAENISPPQ